MSKQLSLLDIEELYDQFGTEYARSRVKEGLLVNDYIERPVILETIKNILIRKKKVKKFKNVLDIGCGPGIYTKDLAGTSECVTAIDLSHEMLEIAKDFCNYNLSSTSNLEFKHTSFENYHHQGEAFDLVVATFMLSYFSDLKTFFKKIQKNLDDSGKLVTSILHPIRLFASQEHKMKSGYYVEKYFQNGFYDSDFIDKGCLVPLKRWNFQDISEAAYESGLLIEKILEPTPTDNLPEQYLSKADYYRQNPSVVIFVLRKM